jgi:hypothetical protein
MFGTAADKLSAPLMTSGKQKWRLANRKWLQLWFGTRYRRSSNGYSRIFDVARSNAA